MISIAPFWQALETPFGGMRDSGHGSEGTEGLDAYLVTKIHYSDWRLSKPKRQKREPTGSFFITCKMSAQGKLLDGMLAQAVLLNLAGTCHADAFETFNDA